MKINNICFGNFNKNKLDRSKSVTLKAAHNQGDTFIKNSGQIPFGYSFSLKSPRGIPCAYCGKPAVVQDDVLKMTYLKGDELINEIDSIISNNSISLTSLNKAEISIIKKNIIENPNLSGKDVLPVAYVQSRERMIQRQLAVYDELESLVETLECPELDDYIDQVKKQDLIINSDISLDELTDFLKNKSHIEFRKDVISNVIKLSAKYVTNDTVDTSGAS